MGEKLLSLEIRGRDRSWSFEFLGDPKHIADWRADGLEVFEVCNIIPHWVPAPLIRAWVFAQDVWNFNNPWGKG